MGVQNTVQPTLDIARLSKGSPGDYESASVIRIARELDAMARDKRPMGPALNLWKALSYGERSQLLGDWVDLVFAAKSQLLAGESRAMERVGKRMWRALLNEQTSIKVQSGDIEEILFRQTFLACLSAERCKT